jgi:hypothetical protein
MFVSLPTINSLVWNAHTACNVSVFVVNKLGITVINDVPWIKLMIVWKIGKLSLVLKNVHVVPNLLKKMIQTRAITWFIK